MRISIVVLESCWQPSPLMSLNTFLYKCEHVFECVYFHEGVHVYVKCACASLSSINSLILFHIFMSGWKQRKHELQWCLKSWQAAVVISNFYWSVQPRLPASVVDFVALRPVTILSYHGVLCSVCFNSSLCVCCNITYEHVADKKRTVFKTALFWRCNYQYTIIFQYQSHYCHGALVGRN